MITPPLLTHGNNAVIIAPSGKVGAKGIKKAVTALQQWGLHVSLGQQVYSSLGVFSASDDQRMADLQKALDDPNISLILCARGGYGITRFIDKLSFTNFKLNPKWIVGFSDITAFHLAAVSKNVLTIHGPMATSFSRTGATDSINKLHKLLFEGKSVVNTGKNQLKTGEATGVLVGGNLTLICESLSTSNEIDTNNKILVLEDVGEYYYRIDRMLNQLARAGKFDKLRGLVIADFSDIKNGDADFKETIHDMILRLTANLPFPIAVSMPIGHTPKNYPFVHGAKYHLSVKASTASLELTTKL